MKENLKAKIMKAIDTDEDLFVVNGSWKTTELVKKAMSDSDWDEVCGRAGERMDGAANRPRFRVDFNEHCDAVSRMKGNAPVTQLVPANTRLRGIKKFIVKLMRVSTGYQQDFNYASVEATENIIRYAVEVSEKAEKQRQIIEKQGKIIDALIAEQERLHGIIDDIKRESH